jgi:lysophospholipase L1-like esterase
MRLRRLLLLPLLAAALLVGEIAWALLVGTDVPYEPPSTGRQETGDPADPTLELVVLGDSTAAGQGAAYDKGIATGAARTLAAQGRNVVWRNLAVSGAEWSDVRKDQLAQATQLDADVVLISAGANDVTGGTSGSSLKKDVTAIVETLRKGNPDVTILMTGVPDMGSTPRLPQPLRWLAGERAKSLNGVVRETGARLEVPVIPILERTGATFRADHDLFSVDRFHPDARGYAVWMAVIEESLRKAVPPPIGRNSNA